MKHFETKCDSEVYDTKHGIGLVKIDGVLGRTSQQAIEHILEEFSKNNIVYVLLDLRAVHFCSSDGFFLLEKFNFLFKKVVVRVPTEHSLLYQIVFSSIPGFYFADSFKEALSLF